MLKRKKKGEGGKIKTRTRGKKSRCNPKGEPQGFIGKAGVKRECKWSGVGKGDKKRALFNIKGVLSSN